MPKLRTPPPSDLRVGTGIDVHRIVAGRALVLGGVTIPWDRGLLGHSDADVLTHAVMDALLGALALGDIGQWFPDSDPAYRDAVSIGLLHRLRRHARLRSWTIVNLDATVLAEAPRIAPYHRQICAALAAALDTPDSRVSVKATTTERLGFPGRGEGMVALATVLVQRRPGRRAQEA